MHVFSLEIECRMADTKQDVVRTRIFVSDVQRYWKDVAWAHGMRFTARGLPGPANTLVEARLVGEPYLVEIEADAIIPPCKPRSQDSV